MTEASLNDFVECYHAENINDRKETYNKDTNENGRWRKYTIKEIKENDCKLDLKWLQEDDGSEDLSLEELLEKIKDKSKKISDAVEELEKLIGKVNK